MHTASLSSVGGEDGVGEGGEEGDGEPAGAVETKEGEGEPAIPGVAENATPPIAAVAAEEPLVAQSPAGDDAPEAPPEGDGEEEAEAEAEVEAEAEAEGTLLSPLPSDSRPLPSASSAWSSDDDDLFARLFRPKAALCGKSFELTVDTVRFVSHPSTISDADRTPSLWCAALPASDETDTADSWRQRALATVHDRRHEISMFNVVFVLALSDKHTSGAVSTDPDTVRYRDLALQLATCLMHEQRRTRYVSRQVETLLELKEAAQGKGLDATALLRECKEASSLANELVQLFDALNSTGTSHMFINGWLRLSVSLCDPSQALAMSIRPYQTLLLLESVPDLVDALPDDTSPELRALVEGTNPFRSFQMLEVDLGIDLGQIVRLAAHLVYWGKGIIITTVTHHSVFRVASTASVEPASAIATQFAHEFPTHSFLGMMAELSDVKPLSTHMVTRSRWEQRLFSDMVVWLLRQRCLLELHTFVHLMLPVQPRQTPGTTSGRRLSVDDQITSASGIKARVSREERHYLERMLAPTVPEDAYTRFLELLPYFRGNHRVDDILWLARTTRKELNSVLRTFSHVLVVSIH